MDADRNGRETRGRCRARGKAHRKFMQEVPRRLGVVASDGGGDVYGSSARYPRGTSGPAPIEGRTPCSLKNWLVPSAPSRRPILTSVKAASSVGWRSLRGFRAR